MRIKQSYDESFECFMLDMKDKYPKSMIALQGLNEEAMDMTKFSQNYFLKKTVADASIDGNANVQVKSIATYKSEVHKGLDKMNSIYLLWKMARKLWGTREANRLIEAEIAKDLNVQDASHAYLPYSYYGQTTVLLKINGRLRLWTLKQLYEAFEDFASYDAERDMHSINPQDVYFTYDPKDTAYRVGQNNHVLNRASYTPYEGEVRERITIEVWDSENGWVSLDKIIRHSHEQEKDFIIYETNNGDFAFVTCDHPVIKSDESEILAQDLVEGDEVLKVETLPHIDMRVSVPRDLAYFTGFVLGDGNCDGYLKNIRYLKDHVFGTIAPHVRFDRGGNIISLYQNDIQNSSIKRLTERLFPTIQFYALGANEDRRLMFTSRAYSFLYGDYFNCGYKHTSYSKRLPDNILEWEDESILALLGGLVDSDGVIHGKRVRVALASYSIIASLYDVLRTRGFIDVRKRFRVFENRLGSNFIFEISFVLDRRLKEFSDKVASLDDSMFEYHSQYYTTIRDNRIRKIHRFKRTDIGPSSFLNQELGYVYDITTGSGRFYANGMVQHNCWAFDVADLLITGLPFVQNYPSTVSKHSDVFLQHTIQLVQCACNELMGATAVPNFLVIYSALLKDDSLDPSYPVPNYVEEPKLFRRYLEQRMQEFVFLVNQPLRSFQTPFTNITLFDSIFLSELCKMYVINGHGIDAEFAMFVQVEFMRIFNDLNKVQLTTFPVLTAQFKKTEDGEIEDKEFFDLVAKFNMPYAHINIFSATNLTALSSCCFDGQQKVIIRGNNCGVQLITLEELYNKPYRGFKENLTVFHNGSWVSARAIKTKPSGQESSAKMFRITTANNKTMTTTADHLHVTLRGDVYSHDLSTEDYLLFNTRTLSSVKERDMDLSFDQGYLVGMYLGDGSLGSERPLASGERPVYQLCFSLSAKKLERSRDTIGRALLDIDSTARLTVGTPNYNNYPAQISSRHVVEFIQEWAITGSASEKGINLECLAQSTDFRRGILQGWYDTDGGNSNRCYTTSPLLAEHMEVLITSLGLQSIIDINDRTDEPVIIRGETYARNYPLYCVRWYSPGTKRSMKDVYVVRNNGIYFKINSIERADAENYVYCMEVNSEEEPYFTLPNGIITHNCRLINNVEDIIAAASEENTNLIGGSSIKVGSFGVTTVNLARIGILSKGDEDEFMSRLSLVARDAYRLNHCRRHLIQNMIDRDQFLLYKYGFIKLDSQYSTLGILGLYEAVAFMGMDILEPQGKEFAVRVVQLLSDISNEAIKDYGYRCNIEQIPGEASLAPEEEVLIFVNNQGYQKVQIGQFVDAYFDKYSDRIRQLSSTSETIDVGDELLFAPSSDRMGHVTNRKITHLVRHQGKPIYDVTLVSGKSISVTGDHSLFTLGESLQLEEIQASHLTKGSFVAVPCSIPETQQDTVIYLTDFISDSEDKNILVSLNDSKSLLRPYRELMLARFDDAYLFKGNDAVRISHTLNRFRYCLLNDIIQREDITTVKHDTSPAVQNMIQLSYEFGWIIGMFLAEGYWSSKKVEISNTNPYLLDTLQQYIAKVFGEQKTCRIDRKPISGKATKETFVLSLGKTMSFVFHILGLNAGREDKEVPGFVYSNHECVKGLIAGFIAGDGSLHYYEDKIDFSIRLYTVSYKLMTGLCTALAMTGSQYTVRLDKKSKHNDRWNDCWVISLYGNKQITTIAETPQYREKGRSGYYPVIATTIAKLIDTHTWSQWYHQLGVDTRLLHIRNAVRAGRISKAEVVRILSHIGDKLGDENRPTVMKIHEVINNDLRFEQVKEVKVRKDIPTYVYDISVEGNENFMAGRKGLILTHNTSIKFAEADKILYGQDRFALYANQFIPLTSETDVLNRIHLQAEFENYFSGGSIMHVNLGQQIKSKAVMKKLLAFVIKAGVQYFAVNYFFQHCAQGHMTIGDDKACPVCGKEIVERSTRIVGFIRPVSSWQKERREEFEQRKKYSEISI